MLTCSGGSGASERAAASAAAARCLPLPSLDGKRGEGEEGEWNGRKPLKPTEHDGDVVFSKERKESGAEKKNYSRLFRGVVFI